MLVVEPPRACSEPADVREPLPRGAAAVMDHAHRSEVSTYPRLADAQAPVEVLEVQKEPGIEALGALDRAPAHEHESAAHDGHRFDHFPAAFQDKIAHFVASEAPGE